MNIIVFYIVLAEWKRGVQVPPQPELKIVGGFHIPDTLPIGKIDEFIKQLDFLGRTDDMVVDWLPMPSVQEVTVTQKIVNVYTLPE